MMVNESNWANVLLDHVEKELLLRQLDKNQKLKT